MLSQLGTLTQTRIAKGRKKGQTHIQKSFSPGVWAYSDEEHTARQQPRTLECVLCTAHVQGPESLTGGSLYGSSLRF